MNGGSMHAKASINLSLLVILTAVTACSIKAPEVRLTGEKTSLEKEILGTYHQMREDTWMVASTRGAIEKTPSTDVMSPEKKHSLDALREQEFNKDDVEEFKQKGYVGETNEGRLSLRPSEELSRIPETAKLVDEIVQEENADRQIIIDRVVELNDALKRAVPKDVSAVFAKMYQENSPAGAWIQKQDGSWIKK
jgi:uncharacterized protein YdbL (DUF1318 family)